MIILDVMLPEVNGFDICESIRLENSKVPILFLTAKSSNEDKLTGLKMADDYLTKPFNLKELLLRVKNLIEKNTNLFPITLKIKYCFWRVKLILNLLLLKID